MRRTNKTPIRWMLSVLLAGAAVGATAQQPARVVGTITAIEGTTLTVKPDMGDARQVDVPSDVSIRRIAPGQKDLSAAEIISFGDLASGDRVLIKLDNSTANSVPKAQQVIAIKQSDVAQKQQRDREEWQRHGVGGLVKTIDSSSGTITLASGFGSAAKTITVHTSRATILKRYAAASVRYDAAQPAPFDAIHAGDQLRARGAKNADGTEIEAVEVVSGAFRNISGVIASLDPAASTFTLKDLLTKKQVTVHIEPDAQMRRLPDAMARIFAARLKGTTAGAATAGNGHAPGQNGTSASGGDPQQMLNRLFAIHFADLKKGDAVMLVSTDGTTDVTGITLLAGVEPLLEAPAASQDLLNNWSLGSGSSDTATQ